MGYIEDLKGAWDGRLKGFIEKTLASMPPAEKLLVIFPDYTRIDFTDIIAPLIADRYSGSRIDFLSAGGTHRHMDRCELRKKLGLKEDKNIKFFNHSFADPASLVTIGRLEKDFMSQKTSGRLGSAIDITVNRLLFSGYGLIIAISATVPHEAAGYSGGLKIFFPGVSGPAVIDAFHWAAVLVGVPDIIGTAGNNARDIIDEGAKAIFSKIACPVYSFNMVNTEDENRALPLGLYTGRGYDGFISAYRKAAAASSRVHIKYIEGPLLKVVQKIGASYDEIWLAGKGSYKLQKPGVLKKGAEVILYGPHIKCFHNDPHIEKDILSLGYHCRDYICGMVEAGADVSKNAASHLVNVAGPGTFDPASGKEDLDFKVTLATSIPKGRCSSAGLGYRDPATIKKENFTGPGKLWIEEGGKYLYDIRPKGK